MPFTTARVRDDIKQHKHTGPYDGGRLSLALSDMTDADGGAVTAESFPHALLDSGVHIDAVTQTVSRGSLIYGNSTPAWDELPVGAANTVVGSNGTDTSFMAFSAFTSAEFLDSAFRIISSTAPNDKKLAFEVDGLSVGTRTLTPQDASYTIAGLETTNIFTDTNTFIYNLFVGLAGSGAVPSVNITCDQIGSNPGISLTSKTGLGYYSTILYAIAGTGDKLQYLPYANGTVLLWNHGSAGESPAAGSIAYGGGASSPMSALAIGTAGQVLTVNPGATAPQWTAATTAADVARTWSTLQTFPDNTLKITNQTGTPDKTLAFQLDNSTAGADLILDYRSAVDRSLIWNLSGGTGGDLTLAWPGTASATMTFPTATTTLAGLATTQTFTGTNTFGTLEATLVRVQDGAGGFSGIATNGVGVTLWQLNSALSGTQIVASLSAAQTWTAAQTFRAANAIRSEAASTQDAVIIAGRAGGTSSRAVTLTPAALTASRTQTLQDAAGTVALTADIPTVDAIRTWTTLQTFDDTTWKITNGTGTKDKTLRFELDGSTALADIVLDYRSAVDRSLIWNLSGGTGGDLTLTWPGTSSATMTLPTASDTLVGRATTDTFTGAKTFGSGTAIFGASADDETIPRFKTSYVGGLTFDAFDILDSATGGSGFKLTVSLDELNPLTADQRVRFPATSGTLVTTASTATLTNKRLSGAGSYINGGTGAGGVRLANGSSTTQYILFGTSALTAARTWTLPDKNLNFDHGTYTPTLTGVANVAASTAYQCQYLRTGNTVTVSGKVDVDPTTTATLTQLGISLPITSNLGAAEDCAGTAVTVVAGEPAGAILGDAANNRAELDFICVSVANNSWYFSFTYEVI